ncbi:MAG: hypothetical protein AB7I19_05735 [Planctomycetota bacterium]
MESVRRASSLPSGVFRVSSPAVERALAADVGDIFLRHMSRTDRLVSPQDGPRAHKPDPSIEARNAVSDDELRALVHALCRQDKISAPHIDDQLDHERAWILLNLSLSGSLPIRRHVLAELRSTLDGTPRFEAVLETATELLAHCDPDRLANDGIAPETLEEFQRTLAQVRRHPGTNR